MSLQIIDLTPLDQERLDPTHRGRDCLNRMKDGPATPVPIPFSHYSRKQWLQLYQDHCARLYTNKHSRYWEWCQSLLSKYGAQGASFSIDEVKACYRRSYELADRTVQFRVARRGRDYLVRYIRQLVERYGIPPYIHAAVEGTSGALPTMLPKGTFQAEYTLAKGRRHVFPNLPGQRSQRLKHRVINQDACINVRYIEGYVAAIRDWLRRYLPQFFGAWLNPKLVIQPTITRLLRRSSRFVGTDYTACDEHFGFPLVCEIVFPIYEALSLDVAEFNDFACFVEELFSQEIYFGTELWCGNHNLLSGQVITNDFETIYDVCLAIGTLLECVIPVDSVAVLALGDDLGIHGDLTKFEAEAVMQTLLEEANLNGMEMSKEKCDILEGSVLFLRNMYYGGLRTFVGSDGSDVLCGAYPTSLALNSIINPERYLAPGPEFVRATLQRLDNCYGSPDFTPFVQMVVSKASIRDKVDKLSVEEARIKDWWTRLYGEDWSLRHSPAYAVMVKSGLADSWFVD